MASFGRFKISSIQPNCWRQDQRQNYKHHPPRSVSEGTSDKADHAASGTSHNRLAKCRRRHPECCDRSTSETVPHSSAFSAGVAQLAPIEYHSDRSGRLVCPQQQVYPTNFKTLSYSNARSRAGTIIVAYIYYYSAKLAVGCHESVCGDKYPALRG